MYSWHRVKNQGIQTMTKIRTIALAASLAVASVGSVTSTGGAYAAVPTAADLNNESGQALQSLYRSNAAAAAISRKAVAILIFPNIVKAGFVFGAAYGEGELDQAGKVDGYYNSITGSWGLQAGAQSYGYAVFLMNNRAVSYLRRTKGLEIGVGPTVVVVNEGIARNLSSSTLKDDAYAFIFDQQGLMAGISIEGTKISRINP
jgi:lipid-binding SYLF domain-containing protein